MRPTELANYTAHFRARVLQDALVEATSAYWLRRAEALEAARHRPGIDYTGQASMEELRARWVALTELAAACRSRATLGLGAEQAVDIDLMLGEVA